MTISRGRAFDDDDDAILEEWRASASLSASLEKEEEDEELSLLFSDETMAGEWYEKGVKFVERDATATLCS